jgi:H+/gluconate symporter-like permease
VVIVGVVLLVLCVALGAAIGLSNPEPTTAEAFGVTLSGLSLGGLFLLGVALGALAVVALGLLFGGAARKRHKKTAVKREIRSARGEKESLAQENARLQEELERERTAALPHTDTRQVVDGSGQRERL